MGEYIATLKEQIDFIKNKPFFDKRSQRNSIHRNDLQIKITWNITSTTTSEITAIMKIKIRVNLRSIVEIMFR